MRQILNTPMSIARHGINKCFDYAAIHKILCIALVFMVAVSFFVLNHHTMLTVDDYVLSYTNGHRIQSFEDIFVRLYVYYFSWTGRVITHFLATFFLWMGKPAFDIANTLAYVGLILLIYIHAVGRVAFFPMILLFANFALFSFVPAFGQDFLWLDGASNYLMSACLVLAFLLPYRLQLTQSDALIRRPVLYPVCFLGGIIAAWTNENMSVTIVCIAAYCMILRYLNDRKFIKWQWYGFAGAFFGAGLLLLAPGNIVRLHTEGGGQHIDIIYNLGHITKLFLDSNYLLFPVLFCVLLAIWGMPDRQDRRIWGMYLLGFLVSMYAMVGSPYYTDRAKLGSLVLCVILASYLYTCLDFTSEKIRKSIVTIAVVLVVFLRGDYRTALHDIKGYEKRESARIEHVLQEKAAGNLNIVVEKNYPSTKYCAVWGLDDIHSDPGFWYNKAFARYYGVETVRSR